MAPELVTSFVTITAIWLVLVITPGPNFVATVHGTVNGSLRDGLLVATGIAAGTAVWAGASLLGLGLLFERAGWLYLMVKTAGAGYLLLVGLRMIWTARRAGSMAITLGPAVPGRAWRALRLGLLTDLSNPKAAAFFTSLFAVAVPPTAPALFDLGIIAMVVAMAAGWYMLVAVALSAERIVRAYRRCQAVIQGLVGALFMGFGAKLLADR